jgi:hypothetical protein
MANVRSNSPSNRVRNVAIASGSRMLNGALQRLLKVGTNFAATRFQLMRRTRVLHPM